MGSEMFYELNARFLFLPQFQVAINGRGDEEISPEARMSVICELQVSQGVLGHDAEIQRISVHEGLVILICIWKMLEI